MLLAFIFQIINVINFNNFATIEITICMTIIKQKVIKNKHVLS